MKRYLNLIREDPVWSRVIGFSLVVLLIRIADAVVSFWVPNLLLDTLHDPVKMGLVISFQSVVGLGADLIFPNLLKNASVKKLMILGMIMSALTSVSLLVSSLTPIMIFFLISMTIWGLYYELEIFATYQFIGSTVPIESRSGAWGILGVFKNLAYFLGPLFATWLLIRGNIETALFTLILLILAFMLFTFRSKMHDRPLEPNLNKIKPWQEIKYWLTLLVHVWPIVIMTLVMGFIDSTFWTTGAVFTEKLARVNPLGALFLGFYQLPSLFTGFVVAKIAISKGKKKFSQKYLFLTGFFLILMILSGDILWQLAMVLASSIALGISYPILDGVFTDIMERLGKEKKHMIGFTSSIVNVSYIIWPPIAGLLTKNSGERMTFVYMGALTAIVSIFLLIVTPKKLKLPQTEIGKWKD
ncbi:MAG TPA: MFS transporter [Patescibacteria group bacterium]